MITYIRGLLIEKNPAYAVIETAAGVAYFIHVSLSTFSEIKDLDNVLLFTHYAVKEDGHTLYGFYTEQERSIFRYLISVNGIGPNSAMLFLSSLSVPEIIHAITTDNVRVLQSVKGIGNKTAQRVIIELKDKIGKMSLSSGTTAAPGTSYNANKYEALSALTTLGYSKNVAENILDKIIEKEGINLSVEDLIKQSLRAL
ncbi:MAG: Holliday junction branch migration protein RuvA [Bacteroidales bacterium]|jgi:Holliday junction DNA helicase RuvA|nr:Holliday junction branch migration protein RuvA [Bacteroidales bacterium]